MCEHVRGEGEGEEEDDYTQNTLPLCFLLSGSEVSDDESHAHIISVYEVWRMVRGGNSQWSDCDSCCVSFQTPERGSVSVYSRESASCAKTGSGERQH